jgi:hypothetical protein
MPQAGDRASDPGPETVPAADFHGSAPRPTSDDAEPNSFIQAAAIGLATKW